MHLVYTHFDGIETHRIESPDGHRFFYRSGALNTEIDRAEIGASNGAGSLQTLNYRNMRFQRSIRAERF